MIVRKLNFEIKKDFKLADVYKTYEFEVEPLPLDYIDFLEENLFVKHKNKRFCLKAISFMFESFEKFDEFIYNSDKEELFYKFLKKRYLEDAKNEFVYKKLYS